MPAAPVLRFEGVTKAFGELEVLRGIDLAVREHEAVALIGASGSGKSTFLRLILREEKPDSGTIHVAGKDLSRLSNFKVPHLRRRIGCVFQDFRLLPNKTVAQNVAFALEVIGKPRGTIRKTVPEVLDLVGLAGKDDRMPGELPRCVFGESHAARPIEYARTWSSVAPSDLSPPAMRPSRITSTRSVAPSTSVRSDEISSTATPARARSSIIR